MAEYKIQGETLTEIADAIRSKTGATAQMSPQQMAAYIDAVKLQEKAVTPTEEVQTVTPDSGYYGLSKVTVEAGAAELPHAEENTFGGSEADIPYEIQGASLTAIANAIQTKKGTTAIFTPGQMASEIGSIVTNDNLPIAEAATFGTVKLEYELGVLDWGTSTSYAVDAGAVGYQFTPTVDITVKGLQITAKSAMSNRSTFLWDENKNVLWSQKVTTVAGTPVDATFSSPIILHAGKTYSVGISVNNNSMYRYPKSGISAQKITIVNGGQKSSSTQLDLSSTDVLTYSNSYNIPPLNLIISPAEESPPEEYKIQTETMTAIADEVNRIKGTSGVMTPGMIVSALQAVPVQTTA